MSQRAWPRRTTSSVHASESGRLVAHIHSLVSRVSSFVAWRRTMIGFLRAHHTDGGCYLPPRCQILHIPPEAFPPSIPSLARLVDFAQAHDIFVEVSPFILQDYQNIFMMRPQEVNEGCLAVKRIRQNHLERTRVISYNPVQQTHSGCH